MLNLPAFPPQLFGDELARFTKVTPPKAVRVASGSVVSVTDGDTVRIKVDGGKTEKVRIIGVDAPEDTTHHDVFGPQATAFTRKALAGGRHVWLELDAGDRDRYGRLLAYVWLTEPSLAVKAGYPSDGEVRAGMLDAQIASAGLARVMAIEPNTRHRAVLAACVAEAQAARRGIWALPTSKLPKAWQTR